MVSLADQPKDGRTPAIGELADLETGAGTVAMRPHVGQVLSHGLVLKVQRREKHDGTLLAHAFAPPSGMVRNL